MMSVFFALSLFQMMPANAPTIRLDQMVEYGPSQFVMGTPEDLPIGRYGDGWYVNQTPAHTVVLTSFALDREEVDLQSYAVFLSHACGAACYDPRMPIEVSDGQYVPYEDWLDYPVTYVDHRSATWYCTWAGKRLPTEAEWEFAAAGVEARTWPWIEEVGPRCAYATFSYDGGRCTDRPVPVSGLDVGQTPEGISHLAGNVSEWVSDVYGPYRPGDARNPKGPDSGPYRVIKGGSYLTPRAQLKAQSRRAADPEQRSPDLGFRCAWDDSLVDPPGVVRGSLDSPFPADGVANLSSSSWQVIVDDLNTPRAVFEHDGAVYVTDAEGVWIYDERGLIAQHDGLSIHTYFFAFDHVVGVDLESGQILGFVETDVYEILMLDGLVAMDDGVDELIITDGTAIYRLDGENSLETWVDEREDIQTVTAMGNGVLWTESRADGPSLLYFEPSSAEPSVVMDSGAVPNPLIIWGLRAVGPEEALLFVGFDGWPFSALLCRFELTGQQLECLHHSPPRADDIHGIGRAIYWRTQFGLYRWTENAIGPLGDPLGPGGVHWGRSGVWLTHVAKGQVLSLSWSDLDAIE